MLRPTKHALERGDARTRLLEAARDVIRAQRFTATSIDNLCRAAGVSKCAFFLHFGGKSVLHVAATEFWSETTSALFEGAPYHEPADPLGRVLAYLGFRRSIIDGEITAFTCLVGTMAQEAHDSHPEIRAARAASIFGHAETLEPDIRAAMAARGIEDGAWTAADLARHTQAVLQGAFILAKASGNPETAIQSVDHLIRYVRLLFDAPDPKESLP